jgi:peptidoglycan/LPS O-acetylase OafA/YrhL
MQGNLSPKPDPTGVRRLHELDALRGLAALAVVFSHFRDMWVIKEQRTFPIYDRAILSGLRFFYAGGEAVLLFFVLSGFVLALPYIRGKHQNYQTFVVRRICRIWLPYIVAFALAIACDAVWHNHAYHGAWASSFWFEPLQWGKIFSQIPLIGHYDNQYLFVSWTLHEEMRISLVFPIVVALTMRLKGIWQLVSAALISLLAVLIVHRHFIGGATYRSFLSIHYVAFFIVGIFLATHLDAIEAKWAGLSQRVRLGVLFVTFFAYMYNVVITTHLFNLMPSARNESLAFLATSEWIAAIGSCGWIILGIYYAPLHGLLLTRIPQFLGKISFSLYLVHPIVLLSLTFAFGNKVGWWAQFPVYIAAVVFLSWLFYLAVEKPAIQLGRRVRL